MSENDVTPEEQKDSSYVMIATRTPNRTEGATVHVNNLDMFFFVHKLADTPAVLSQDKLSDEHENSQDGKHREPSHPLHKRKRVGHGSENHVPMMLLGG